MFRRYLDLLGIVWKENPSGFLAIQFLLIINAMFELLGIASVTPLLGMMLSPEKFHESKLYQYVDILRRITGFQDEVLLVSICSLICIIVGALSSILAKITVQRFSFRIGEKISARLFRYYLNRDYIDHVTSNSTVFVRNVLQESNRMVTHVLNPMMQINVSLVALAIVISLVFFVNPLLSVSMLLIVGAAFGAFYLFSKRLLYRNSKVISEAGNLQYAAVGQSFAGIKDIKLYTSEDIFIHKYSSATRKINSALVRNFSIMVLPGHLLQMGVFVFIISIATTIHIFKNQSFFDLSELMFFAVAGYKILPSVNTIYSNISTTQGNITAYDRIAVDVGKALTLENDVIRSNELSVSQITFDHVSFSYVDDRKVIDNLSLNFFSGKVYGLAGPSGSGKTTLVDIVAGLLDVSTGNVQINGTYVSCDDIRAATSYVSQETYVVDGSFLDNVCFGQAQDEFDRNKASRAMMSAGLGNFNLDDLVGETGKSLSGGQRQRVGIARALYRDKSIMIFDESTSALDGVTEFEVMNNILKLRTNKIIIIVAHRLTTLKACDQIFVLEKGRVVQTGDYDSLIFRKDGLFWEMATKGGFEK